jgi:hypothetical protein
MFVKYRKVLKNISSKVSPRLGDPHVGKPRLLFHTFSDPVRGAPRVWKGVEEKGGYKTKERTVWLKYQ